MWRSEAALVIICEGHRVRLLGVNETPPTHFHISVIVTHSWGDWSLFSTMADSVLLFEFNLC